MSKRYGDEKAYNFTCKKLNEFIFEIKWDVDYYLLDSTVTRGRVFTRFTDEKGALRFCKKHGIDFENYIYVNTFNSIWSNT